MRLRGLTVWSCSINMPAQLLNRRKFKQGLVSPLLSMISRRMRVRLQRQHGIDVDKVKAESRELYQALGRWWLLPAPPRQPGALKSCFWKRLDNVNNLFVGAPPCCRAPG
jgi:hypothetical protein